VDFLAVGGRPDLCAEQPEATLHEAVVEVGQDYVVAPGGDIGVESDGPLLPGVGMDQAGQARLP